MAATTVAMSPRRFSSMVRLGLQQLPPRLLDPEIPPRLRNKLQRHPNRHEPSLDPVIQDDVIFAARKLDPGSILILKRGQHQKQEPKQADQHEVNEESKTTTAVTTTAQEGDQQNKAKEEEADKITAATTTTADNLHKSAKDAEEDQDDNKGLWHHYFATIAPSLMPPPPAANPFPSLLLRKPLVN